MENPDRELPIGAGKSSFELVDREKVFGELQLKRGSVFLDLACGRGRYALAASNIVGKGGLVYAVDLWEEGIEAIREEAAVRGIRNLKTLVADVAKKIPIKKDAVQVCLMATVLHDLVEIGVADRALREVRRVLSPSGSLVIIEFQKVEPPPGPPLHIRLEPEEVMNIVRPHGFREDRTRDVGPFNYAIRFSLS